MQLLSELHREHAEIRRILDCIDEALAVIEAADRELDFSELAEAMYFMTEFRDIVHHSKEALLLRQLARRRRDLRGLARDVSAGHAALKADGVAFLELLEDAAEDAIVARDDLLDRGRRYSQSQRAHLQRLEESVLPRAEQHLTSQDWRAIKRRLDCSRDETIEEITREHFDRLHERLAEGGAVAPIAAASGNAGG
ncbi:hypothetical protein H0Z60_04710 [Ectothiorhodospiraceae bacterium WFHF3C12]|nr:hypothetical protein [Ectothiorhodospiraceae bacterium WFHF3C12]